MEPEKPKTEEMWGHVVRQNFSPDPVQATREVKQILAQIRGHLVECPLRFLEEEDIAKEGVVSVFFKEKKLICFFVPLIAFDTVLI